MNQPLSEPNPAARPTLSRRTAIAGAAWAVPAISLLAATPAAAASTDPPVVLLTPTTPTLPGVRRCSVIPTGVISFAVTVNGAPAPDGEVVHVTVPEGFAFVGEPDPHAVDVPVVGGMVTVPDVRVVGALGTYSVNASLGLATGAVSVPVTEIAPGALFTWSQVNSTAPSVAQNAGWPQSAVVDVADSAFVAVDPTGRVSYWGPAFFSGSSVGTVTAVTGITDVAVWSTYTTEWYAGILMTDGTAAWYASADKRGALTTPTRLSGYTGSILDIRVHDGATYLLTTDGIFYGGGAINGSSMTSLRGPISESAGATQFDTWCANTDKFYTGGGFVTADGRVVQFTANATTALNSSVLAGAPADIVKLYAGNNAVAVLTTSGDLYTRGAAFQSGSWTKRYSGIADFSGWSAAFGTVQAAGLAMLTRDGGILETYSASNSTWRSATVTGLTGQTIVDVVASDGFYQALDSAGTLWVWTGNADGTVSKAIRLAGQPSATASLSAYGIHRGSFYGYGIGIASAACPV